MWTNDYKIEIYYFRHLNIYLYVLKFQKYSTDIEIHICQKRHIFNKI